MENIVEKNKRTLLYLSSNFFELPMYRLKALSFDLIITLKKDHGMVHKKYEIIFCESLQICIDLRSMIDTSNEAIIIFD